MKAKARIRFFETGASIKQHLMAYLLWGILLEFGSSLAQALPPMAVVIASPNHPRTWYVNELDKFTQILRWDDEDQTLYLDVTYSLNGEWPLMDSNDPDQYGTFTVSFPDVHQNEAHHELYYVDGSGHKFSLGWIKPGVFGKKVVLRDNVKLSAHRRNGVLKAMLIVDQASTL